MGALVRCPWTAVRLGVRGWGGWGGGGGLQGTSGLTRSPGPIGRGCLGDAWERAVLTDPVLTFLFQKEGFGQSAGPYCQRLPEGAMGGGCLHFGGDSSQRNPKRCLDRAPSVHSSECQGLLILDQATLSHWDGSHITGKEPEAKTDWVVCQSWEAVELDLNSRLIDVEAQAGSDLLPGPGSAKPGSRGPRNAHTS